MQTTVSARVRIASHVKYNDTIRRLVVVQCTLKIKHRYISLEVATRITSYHPLH